LIDYAGLFPPATLTLDRAVAEFERARHGPHAWMLGRFIIPAASLTEPRATGSGPFSAIVDDRGDALAQLGSAYVSGARIEVLEIALAKTLSHGEVNDAVEDLRQLIVAAGLDGLPAYVELPRSHREAELRSWMSALDQHDFGAKLRCGGLAAEAFPSVEEVAEFIAAAVAANVPFKATAGLHHPVRHYNAQSGFTMHGFLNLLAAAALARRVDRPTLRAIVAEKDSAAFSFDGNVFAWRDQRIDEPELAACRRERFVAYGSCSFSEPVEDLAELGILPPQ
jgi:hypothetical protein